MFKYYSNFVSQASRSLVGGLFVIGLMLIGFGLIIIAMPELFAWLAATVFFIAGLGCAVTAVKVFWSLRRIDKMNGQNQYRENVEIHIHRDDVD